MISLITSLYKSDRYIDSFQKRLVFFADFLLKENIDFEIIVIANDPTNRENEFGRFFKDKTWFNYLTVPRESLYATWNRGLRAARGNVLGFWNVDDARRPEAIIDAVKSFSGGAQLVYFPFLTKWYLNILSFSFLVKWKKIVPPIFDRNEFTRSMHCGPFFLFSKALYDSVGPFDEQFKIVADFDWCIRAAKFTDKFVLSKQSAGFFRVDGKGLSSGGSPLHSAENNVVYKRYGVKEKIINGFEGIESAYCKDKIKIDEKYVDLNS